MQKKTLRFSGSSVDYYFSAGRTALASLADRKNSVLVTDENVYMAQHHWFKGREVIVLKAGELFKVQSTVDHLVGEMIKRGMDRSSLLVGVGGGVITDMTGYAASIYMRGIRFGFVPTTLLAMVDAAIGGKNGVDVGPYKNMVGIIRQPAFIVYDPGMLNTLPDAEWQNGFAEVIKHAAIRDAAMFRELEKNDLAYYRKNKKALALLVQRNALLKSKLVQQDEFEKGDRKLLNFGHTLGHAIETQYGLSHGHAISIGMGYASALSKIYLQFKERDRLLTVLEKYGLPHSMQFDLDKTIEVLKMDKKKTGNEISFVLLQKIGRGVLQKIGIDQLYKQLS